MEVPNDYKMAGLLNLIGGALNIMTASVWVLSLIWVCVGVLWIVPVLMGAWQAYVGFTMNTGTPTGQGKIAAIVGLVAGLFNFNPLTILLAIVVIVQLGKPEVAGWLESRS